MIISFFEEFPTKRNFQKLRLVRRPTKLYLGCSSLQEFRQVSSRIKNTNVRECIYWPLLKKNEGYWISPFSQRTALERIFKEMRGKTIPVMLDLELPTTHNPLLYITQSWNFFGNKRTIQNFISTYPGEVYLAEYYPEGRRSERILQFFGLHYPGKKVKVIKMLYRSMHHFKDYFLRKELQRGKQKYKHDFIAAFGVIAPGIHGIEAMLSPEQLELDLEIAKKAGMKEVILFRLGGLNREYVKVVEKFAST